MKKDYFALFVFFPFFLKYLFCFLLQNMQQKMPQLDYLRDLGLETFTLCVKSMFHNCPSQLFESIGCYLLHVCKAIVNWKEAICNMNVELSFKTMITKGRYQRRKDNNLVKKTPFI